MTTESSLPIMPCCKRSASAVMCLQTSHERVKHSGVHQRKGPARPAGCLWSMQQHGKPSFLECSLLVAGLSRAERWCSKTADEMHLRSASISWAATLQAAPKPTISGAGRVPLRRPRSCPPPLICGSSRTRGRRLMYSAPASTTGSTGSARTHLLMLLFKHVRLQADERGCMPAVCLRHQTGLQKPVRRFASRQLSVQILLGHDRILQRGEQTHPRPWARTACGR